MLKKILLLGSAPYVKDWYKQNGSKYFHDGFQLATINNAWAVCPERVVMWFRSEDYFFIPNMLKPNDAQRARFIEIVEMLDYPFFYQKKGGGGTILFNVLCHLMNSAFSTKTKLWVSLAGCDMVYKPGGANWFYGNGTPDPLRLGEERLRGISVMLKELAEKFDYVIANAGGQDETLLPYARHQL